MEVRSDEFAAICAKTPPPLSFPLSPFFLLREIKICFSEVPFSPLLPFFCYHERNIRDAWSPSFFSPPPLSLYPESLSENRKVKGLGRLFPFSFPPPLPPLRPPANRTSAKTTRPASRQPEFFFLNGGPSLLGVRYPSLFLSAIPAMLSGFLSNPTPFHLPTFCIRDWGRRMTFFFPLFFFAGESRGAFFFLPPIFWFFPPFPPSFRNDTRKTKK